MEVKFWSNTGHERTLISLNEYLVIFDESTMNNKLEVTRATFLGFMHRPGDDTHGNDVLWLHFVTTDHSQAFLAKTILDVIPA